MSVLMVLLKKNKVWVIVTLIAALLSNLSQMFCTLCIGSLVNKIENRAAIGFSFVALLGVFILLNALTLFFDQYIGRVTAEKMAHSLRMGYAGKLIRNGAGAEKSTDMAAAMSVAQNELAQADAYLSNTFFNIFGMIFTGIIATVFLLFQNVILTLVLIIPTLFILIYVTFSSRKQAAVVVDAMEEKRRMNKVAYSVVHAFGAVKVFEGESFTMKAYERSVLKWKDHAARTGRWAAVYNTLSGILSRIPLLLLLLVGSYMVINGKILLGTLIVFLNLQNSLTMSVMNLPNWISGFKIFTTNLSRIGE